MRGSSSGSWVFDVVLDEQLGPDRVLPVVARPKNRQNRGAQQHEERNREPGPNTRAVLEGGTTEERRGDRRARHEQPGPSAEAIDHGLLLGERADAFLVRELIFSTGFNPWIQRVLLGHVEPRTPRPLRAVSFGGLVGSREYVDDLVQRRYDAIELIARVIRLRHRETLLVQKVPRALGGSPRLEGALVRGLKGRCRVPSHRVPDDPIAARRHDGESDATVPHTVPQPLQNDKSPLRERASGVPPRGFE
jgi:hypothetical protein